VPPNPSVEARPNGKPPGPRGRPWLSSARGPGVFPLRRLTSNVSLGKDAGVEVEAPRIANTANEAPARFGTIERDGLR